MGSSPLARGLPFGEAGEDARVRIIPARAGFTQYAYANPEGDLDHPRSRGVYVTARVVRRSLFGSSPLARGLPSVAIAVG